MLDCRSLLTAALLCAYLGPLACRHSDPTCAEPVVEHARSPSVTTMTRDVTKVQWASCDDGHTYALHCRHGSLYTKCTCWVDDAIVRKQRRQGHLSEASAAALAFANETCEWTLR